MISEWAERLGLRAGCDSSLPLVLLPVAGNSDLIAWAAVNRNAVEAVLNECGAILFRGFNLDGVDDVERFATIVSRRLMEYQDRATKRSHVAGRVYTSTDSPSHYAIALHNEMSFAATLPARVFFYCVQPAAQGGRTPLADVRRVYDRLAPELRERFAERGVRYVRNFGGGPGMSWAETFQVASRDELEAYCQQAGIEFEWLPDGRLRTEQVRPAVARHPQTKRSAWVNHAAVLHVSALAAPLREVLVAEFGPRDLPQNTFLGDGTPLSDDELVDIRAAYADETIHFDWQAGDLLLLDNLAVAHGREPFEGPRQVVAVLADPLPWSDLSPFSPSAAGAAVATAVAAPPTAQSADSGDSLEGVVAATFSEVLGRTGVGLDDDFFDLGGDSLRAAQVTARLIKHTGKGVSIRMIFDERTVRGLAKAVGEMRPPGQQGR
jgi:alpha-ketoglutarate-dependent taurine dioxygenase/acyl carrier protein